MNKIYIAFISLLAIGSSAFSQTYVNQNANGSNDGTSWEDAYINLQDALSQTEGSEIWIAKGVYKPQLQDTAIYFLVESSHSLYGGFEGNETELSQRDPKYNIVTLDGDILGDDVAEMYEMNRSDNSAHILYIPANSFTVVVDGINFIGGTTQFENNDVLFYERGGAIYSFSNMTINNCSFNENAGRSGSAIHLVATNNSIISNCSFSQNYCLTQGVVLLNGCTNTNIQTCKFEDNVVVRACLYTFYTNETVVDQCSFENNNGHPDNWGGVGYFNWNSINVNITNSQFVNNSSAGNASILYCDGRELNGETQVNFDNCLFKDNSSDNYGGNMYFWRANYTLNNCEIIDNSASNGGAIYNGNSKFEVSNTLFRGNSAEFGAATLNYNEDTEGSYIGCTFEENIASTSGAGCMIGFLANINLDDCIFEKNEARWGAACYIQNDTSVINISSTEFIGNASTNAGGAIAAYGSFDINIEDCNFEANSADFGGAINMIDDSLNFGSYQIERTSFTFNFGTTQGGALNIGNYDGTIISSLFANNESTDTGNGGAISNNAFEGQSSNMELTNSTLAENNGSFASGISNFEDLEPESEAIVTLTNSILFNLSGGGDYAIEQGEPELISNGGNLVFNPSLAMYVNNTNDLVEDDPLFISASQGDFSLSDDSPCINTGVATGAHTIDIDGNEIIGLVDKGCYENQNPVSSKNIISDRVARIINNPASSFTSLELNHAYKGDVQISVLNALGQEMRNFKIAKTDSELIVPIDVREWKAGNYFISMRLGKMSFTKPFIKI